MPRSLLRGCLLFVLAAFSGGAATLNRDLGQGLVYVRARDLPLDLPAAEPGPQKPCVLDLRYAHGNEQAATALDAWLKFRVTSRTPVFVLANADTAPALLAGLMADESLPGLLVIGVAARGFRPTVAVQSTLENERRAYEALENGVAPASLLLENPDKVRNDEASLARDRPGEVAADAAAGEKEKRPPIDAALQRAVHLHRALRALRKI